MARTEEQMKSEMTGMAAPTEGMPMEGEEGSTTIDAMSMVANFQQMPEENQNALRPLFQDPVRPVMETLLGSNVVSTFVSEVGIEDAPMEAEAPMEAPASEGMMAPEEPMPAMAMGGMLNTQMRDMVSQGMSPEDIRNKLR